MIKLEETFVSGAGGWAGNPLIYKLVKRTNNVAMYQRIHKDGHIVDYEVFFIKITPKGTTRKFQDGTIIITEDDTEKYPYSELFGKIAWSCGNLDHANERYEFALKKYASMNNVDEEEEIPVYVIPNKAFTVNDFAALNNISHSYAAKYVKIFLDDDMIRFVEEKVLTRGKPSKFYMKN